jgi:hypothetical protein
VVRNKEKIALNEEDPDEQQLLLTAYRIYLTVIGELLGENVDFSENKVNSRLIVVTICRALFNDCMYSSVGDGKL